MLLRWVLWGHASTVQLTVWCGIAFGECRYTWAFGLGLGVSGRDDRGWCRDAGCCWVMNGLVAGHGWVGRCGVQGCKRWVVGGDVEVRSIVGVGVRLRRRDRERERE